MKGADFRRVIHNAGALFGIDQELLAALASLKEWSDDIEMINAVYTAGAQLRHMFGIFGTYENALRGYHSGVSPANWTPATEAFVRTVDEAVSHIQTTRKALAAPEGAGDKATVPAGNERAS